MAKKVKCIECDNSMDWAIPNANTLRGSDFLIDTLRNTIVCSYTMKTKSVDHCQYCKHYEHKEDGFFDRQNRRDRYEKELDKRIAELA